MQIGTRLLNSSTPPLVVAEISCNHKQDLRKAKTLIASAKECGCDAVKFQTYKPHHITLEENQLNKTYLPWSWHPELFEFSQNIGIMAWSSVFAPEAVDFLEKEINPICYKLASFEINHFPLLERLKETGKPLIISTGMMNFNDLQWFKNQYSALNTMLLKCVSNYPAKADEFNILTIPGIRNITGFEVGLSDHTQTLGVSIASVALGARMIERHFTIEGGTPDDKFSLRPKEMAQLCKEVRVAYDSLGSINWTVQGDTSHFRSLYATMDIQKGDSFNTKNIGILRPNKGINAREWYRFLRSTAGCDIKKGEPLHYRHLD